MDSHLRAVLVDASVQRTATFAEAAAELLAAPIPAIAVLDGRQVVGLFGDQQLLHGLFPAYLGELHHTAFVQDDGAALAAHLEQVGTEPVEDHMARPEMVQLESSATHSAELFLHCGTGALAVVEGENFVGMLGRLDFCRVVSTWIEAAVRD